MATHILFDQTNEKSFLADHENGEVDKICENLAMVTMLRDSKDFLQHTFTGEYCSKPTLSFRGNSHQEKRSELLSRVHIDRYEREVHKQQQNAALIIQSHYRSYVCRKLLFAEMSLEYETLLSQFGGKDITLLHSFTRQLLFMSTVKLEMDKFVSLCQQWLKMKHEIIRTSDKCVWVAQLKKLLAICCRILQDNIYSSVAIPLRMIEVFTDPRTVTVKSTSIAILECLSKCGAFASLVSVLERSIPLPDSTSIRSSLATTLLPVISTLLSQGNEIVLQSFVATVMARPLTAHMIHLVIPGVKEYIPLSSIISAVKTTSSQNMFIQDTLYCLLSIVEGRIAAMKPPEVIQLVDTIGLLLEQCGPDDFVIDEDNELFGQPYLMYELCDPLKSREQLQSCCLCKVSSWELATAIVKIINHGDILKPLSRLCYQLLKKPYSYHTSCLFQLLSLHPVILKHLWRSITSMQSVGIFGSASVLKQLAGGVLISSTSSHDLIPQLVTFSAIFQLMLFTLHDAEFYGDITVKSPLPFTLSEICSLSGILRDVMVTISLGKHLPNPMIHRSTMWDAVTPPSSAADWNCLFTHLRKLLRLLHERDSRRSFCPKDHWVANLPYHKLDQLPVHMFEEDFEDESLTRPLRQSVIQTRDLLQRSPYVFSFTDRVNLFWRLVKKSKTANQGNPLLVLFAKEPHISLEIRRNKLYSDSFTELASPDIDIRKNLRVTMVNALRIKEPGFGPGVLREFLSELIKESFDPNGGLFCSTDQEELFPNPQAHMIMKDYQLHYFFIGRLLGKALYENLVLELPLASFFLCKILSGGSVDIHHLASLDPQLYRNLLSLKETSVADLYLTFSNTSNSMGNVQTIDLKPNGSALPVTDDNKFEYIHLVANYRLNRQLSRQCESFREGLANVIPCKWFQFFSHYELC